MLAAQYRQRLPEEFDETGLRTSVQRVRSRAHLGGASLRSARRGSASRRSRPAPTLIPPSFGGTTAVDQTRTPAATRPDSTTSVSSAFWNTPPVSTTVSMIRSRWPHAPRVAAVAAERLVEPGGEHASVDTPRARSWTIAATIGAGIELEPS